MDFDFLGAALTFFCLFCLFIKLCFWETREIGCQKRSCGFYHKLPRTIEGLFMPPTSDVQVKTDIIHYQPLKFVIPLMDSDEEDENKELDGDVQVKTDIIHYQPLKFVIPLMDSDEEDENKELDGVKREERVKTKEEEEEEKAILAVCRSAGDLYKLCEDNERHEGETPEGGDNPRQEAPNIGEKKKSAPSCEKGNGERKSADNHTAPVHDNGSDPDKNSPKPHESPSKHETSTYWKGHQHFYRGGDNPRQEPPNIGDKKNTAPSCEKGNRERRSADNHTAPVDDNGSDPDKKSPKPHESPSKHERSTYWKGHQHFYRVGYSKDREKNSGTLTAMNIIRLGDNPRQKPPNIGDKKNAAPSCEKGNRERRSADNHTAPVDDNGSDPDKKSPKPHESPSKHERSTYWKGHQHFYRDYRKDGQRWRKKIWYTDCDEYYQLDNYNYDNYQSARKPPGKGWRRTYPTDIVWYQSHHKKGSEENRKVLTPYYEEKKKSTDNYYPSRKFPARSQRKRDVTWDKNNENYQPFRKPHDETHWKDKAFEKNTGHKQNFGYSPSKGKNKDVMTKSKSQFIQRHPVMKKTDQEESRSGALKDSVHKI
ncbi:uncharacterized protein LOC143805996 isoform X3 [Ranitomeya variabilis]|uniref:uncharacterized protein LOC143805996 isoform X3 n=1 Tax=Ranitomeya variabilis TaxID=490064 RepID=UPI0040569884